MLAELHAQALEGILASHEDTLTKWRQGLLGDAPQICIICWGEFQSCICGEGRYWPINHAVGRLRALLGFEGYDLD